jgi:hypothetical protein
MLSIIPLFCIIHNFNSRLIMVDGPCCGFTRKTVVMTVLGMSCLMLVVWTIIITAIPPPAEEVKVIVKANTTYPSLLAVCPLNSSLPLERVSLVLTKDKMEPKTKQVNIGVKKTHCKCLCEIDATEEELEEAMKLARKRRLNRKTEME